jgi:hypothetical protein
MRMWAGDIGNDCIWTLNGEPRHPSRWDQYVSDRHGRASGATFSERIAQVLTSVPLATLCPEGGSRDEVTTCPEPVPSAGRRPS